MDDRQRIPALVGDHEGAAKGHALADARPTVNPPIQSLRMAERTDATISPVHSHLLVSLNLAYNPLPELSYLEHLILIFLHRVGCDLNSANKIKPGSLNA